MSGEDEQRISSIATDIADQLIFIQERKHELIKIERELQALGECALRPHGFLGARGDRGVQGDRRAQVHRSTSTQTT